MMPSKGRPNIGPRWTVEKMWACRRHRPLSLPNSIERACLLAQLAGDIPANLGSRTRADGKAPAHQRAPSESVPADEDRRMHPGTSYIIVPRPQEAQHPPCAVRRSYNPTVPLGTNGKPRLPTLDLPQ